MYVVSYHHSFGDEHHSVKTLEDAKVKICQIIMEYVSDIIDPDTEMRIVELISQRKWDEARMIYQQHSKEMFIITIQDDDRSNKADEVVELANLYLQNLRKSQ